jgi:hypothetical protein
LVEALAAKPVPGRGPLKTPLSPVIRMVRRRPAGLGATGSRDSWYLNPADESLVWNAILLHGLFGAPKIVVTLIRDKTQRPAHVDWARQLFLDRQSVAGLGLLRQNLIILLDRLIDADLRIEKLPNPFADALPQMGLGPHSGNLLKTLASQTAALSLGDSMMAHYLNGELELAYEKACGVSTENALLLKYRLLIIKEYEDAKEFDDLLDFLR